MEEIPIMEIKFSHNYPKLHGQVKARLLEIEVFEKRLLHPDFISYDTIYLGTEGVFPCGEKYYPLPTGTIIVLIFLGDKYIPFTTVRRWTAQKEQDYRAGINQVFDIIIEENKKS